jgi:hypothetical protein
MVGCLPKEHLGLSPNLLTYFFGSTIPSVERPRDR